MKSMSFIVTLSGEAMSSPKSRTEISLITFGPHFHIAFCCFFCNLNTAKIRNALLWILLDRLAETWPMRRSYRAPQNQGVKHVIYCQLTSFSLGLECSFGYERKKWTILLYNTIVFITVLEINTCHNRVCS